jgi:hypothetical protein
MVEMSFTNPEGRDSNRAARRGILAILLALAAVGAWWIYTHSDSVSIPVTVSEQSGLEPNPPVSGTLEKE